jgi:hypothetical protein
VFPLAHKLPVSFITKVSQEQGGRKTSAPYAPASEVPSWQYPAQIRGSQEEKRDRIACLRSENQLRSVKLVCNNSTLLSDEKSKRRLWLDFLLDFCSSLLPLLCLLFSGLCFAVSVPEISNDIRCALLATSQTKDIFFVSLFIRLCGK